MVCAADFDHGVDTCQGDSGGPLVCDIGGIFYVLGATSFGYKCAEPGYPGVYARISAMLPWIETMQRCMSHDYICNGVKDCPGNEDEKGCAVKCPDVSYIENGRSFQENWQRPENTYQSVIRYSCDERTGYSIDGDARRVCQADGTWSGRMPQCTRRCTLTKSTDITYWNLSHNTELSTPQTVINRSRVRVRLTCPQMIGEYIDYYHGDEADDRNEKEAEIECVDGEFTMHYLTCETAETDGQSSSYSTNDPCKTIANGKITDRGKSVECETNHHLAFSNGMDTSLYTRYSCKCDTTFGIFSCLGSRVACKPNNCTMPSNLEQGLTLYDVKERQFISGANRYEIPHGGEMIFNCAPSGDKYYEPSNRTFNCYQGSWVAQHLSGKEPWSFDNNVTFPACRPVNCSVNHCKFGGHCIQDFKCQCPQHTTGEHCEHPICSKGCKNGGNCTAPDTCACKDGFSGRSCEFAGCSKPEGNLVNLKEQFYGDGETIMITERNCENGYLPSSGDITLNCKNGQWSDKVSCVTANTYLMRIVTSNQWLAGTDGNVMIKLTGSKGHTGRIQLQGPFGANEVKAFNKTLIDVGTIHTIELGVYRVQWLDGWKPKHVGIQDINREHFYYFPHDESEVDDKLTTLQRKSCPSTFNKTAAYVDKTSIPNERRYINFDFRTSSDFECLLKCIERECLIAEYMKRPSFCASIFRKDVKITSFNGNSTFVYKRNCV
ncbi:hypothetical protein DPMN_153634 [Dreissena polymorpha]|uniref:Sushi, von Willebrand factor type A, EGF and pentraxin domain-containing protein 1 n=1 Tax=Dreissena polymorpha TaxID=45954 RepID=A0A9D4FP90_DREPO|nr:hypothetical protein DPMN_153634 [Dreissena polymorpha]